MGKRQLEAFEALAFLRERTNDGKLTSLKELAARFRVDHGVAANVARQLLARQVVDYKIRQENAWRQTKLFFACDTDDWESRFDGDFDVGTGDGDFDVGACDGRGGRDAFEPPSNFAVIVRRYYSNEITATEAAKICRVHVSTFHRHAFKLSGGIFKGRGNGRPAARLPADFDEIASAWFRDEITSADAARRCKIAESTFVRYARERLQRRKVGGRKN